MTMLSLASSDEGENDWGHDVWDGMAAIISSSVPFLAGPDARLRNTQADASKTLGRDMRGQWGGGQAPQGSPGREHILFSLLLVPLRT